MVLVGALKKLVVGFVLLGSATSFASNSFYDARCLKHGNQIILDYDHEKFKGRVALPLKRVVERNCGYRFDVDRYRLKKVTLLARDKKDYSSVTLQVGRHFSRSKPVPEDYDFVELRTPRRAFGAFGNWRLHVRGKIKVDKIILKLERRIIDRDDIEPIDYPF